LEKDKEQKKQDDQIRDGIESAKIIRPEQIKALK